LEVSGMAVSTPKKTSRQEQRECVYCHRQSPTWQFLANPVMPNGIDPFCYRCRAMTEKRARYGDTTVKPVSPERMSLARYRSVRNEFDRKWRLLILDRDRDKCRVCGETRRLDVHHIVPIQEGGLNEYSNLITLCGRCHGKAEGGNPTRDTLYLMAVTSVA
jgi:hypothetical protein